MPQITPYKDTAEQMYFQMTKKREKIDVKIDPSTSAAAALSESKTLLLHPLMLLRPEDLPKELQVKGPDDPRLKRKEYFPQLKAWLAKTFDIKETKLTNLKSFFDLHLRLWKRPHLIDRIKKFVLAHEMGHISLKHTTSTWDKFLCFLFTILFTALAVELFSFYLAVALSLLVSDLSRKMFEALREYSEQYQETEADKAAFRVTKDFHSHHQNSWNSTSLSDKVLHFLLQPETFFYTSHPSPENRIHCLRNHHQKA